MTGEITRQEARHRDWVQVTVYDAADAVVETVNGKVKWFSWCHAEVRRLRDGGRDAAVVVHGKQLAVFGSPPPKEAKA